MRLSDSTIADASDTPYVLETPAQFFARGGVVTVVVPARARGFVESLSKAKRPRHVGPVRHAGTTNSLNHPKG
jgi:hypothetical protein